MNAPKFFAVAALAALSSVAAHAGAGEAVAPEYTQAFVGKLSRTEVQAEAAKAPSASSLEYTSSRVAAPPLSGKERSAVRAEAAQALRRGQIPRGVEHSL